MSMDTAIVERLTMGCRILAEQDIIDAYGHLSARVPGRDDQFLINRAMSPALATEEDFVVMTLDGQVVEGNGFPNQEWPIHACVYRARPDVASVLHSHSHLSRVFSLSPVKLRGVVMGEVLEFKDGLPIYPAGGLIRNVERGDKVAGLLGQGTAMLLKGHGDVVVGRDVVAAVMRAVRLKQNAAVLNAVLTHGEPDYWSPEDGAGWAEPMQQAASPEAMAGLANRIWDYYEARVNGRLRKLLNQ
jgi:ribulose-5-phosphate 4-epimerase/fuculose-1-phosphate aldolase